MLKLNSCLGHFWERSFQTKWDTQQTECFERQNTVCSQKKEAALTVIYLENEILNISLTMTSVQLEWKVFTQKGECAFANLLMWIKDNSPIFLSDSAKFHMATSAKVARANTPNPAPKETDDDTNCGATRLLHPSSLRKSVSFSPFLCIVRIRGVTVASKEITRYDQIFAGTIISLRQYVAERCMRIIKSSFLSW